VDPRVLSSARDEKVMMPSNELTSLASWGKACPFKPVKTLLALVRIRGRLEGNGALFVGRSGDAP